MSKVKVSASISIDGFGAGPRQSLENPMGVGGEALGEWVFAAPTFQRMHGKDWTLPAEEPAAWDALWADIQETIALARQAPPAPPGK